MLNTEVLQNFLLSIKQTTHAETVSLLINASNELHPDILLFHEGADPLSEFLNITNAILAVSERIESSDSNKYLEGLSVGLWESVDTKGYILRINLGHYFQRLAKNKFQPDKVERRDNSLIIDQPIIKESLWIGLNFANSAVPEFIKTLINFKGNNSNYIPETATDWFVQLLCQGGAMVWQNFKYASLFKDPNSQLPGQIEFQISLKKNISEAVNKKTSVGLLLLNPDEFVTINQRLGREQGDLALTEISDKLLSILRSDDLVFRYVGAIFALILPKANLNDINILTEKIHKGLSGNYLQGSAQLTFSVGVSILPPESHNNLQDDVLNLVKQADQALNLAKLSGGSHTIVWDEENIDSSVLSLDRLGNIFTSESEKDYRNMLLLWDTLAVISKASDSQQIAVEFIERVKQTLKPYRIGLFEDNKINPLHTLATRYGVDSAKDPLTVEWSLTIEQKRLLETVKQGRRTERIRDLDKENNEQTGIVAYGFPLLVREEVIGYLYIDGPEASFTLDTSDLVFLNALTRQLALAFDRSALQLRWKEEKEKESRILKQEVRELRQAIHSAKLIYCSEQMHALLDTLSSVAPTDVTILINGESGTGKEMLAQAIHEKSLRNKNPLITVDCGAIAYSLMESELFGHVKGAYTGAQGASQGKIVQAEGGTLFLDEVGELPLDVQAKLLRFVQEKEINPVGGGKTKRVDVRIIAATNKDLAEEVAAGRFRGDLYYRLNVITLKAPALRDRPDDIIPLARYFLEKFAVQYGKGVLHLSDETERAILAYQWPGNIRELQNTIMRAAVLSKKESIELDLLNLNPGFLSVSSATLGFKEQKTVPIGGVTLTATELPQSTEVPMLEGSNDIWTSLRENLSLKIKSILEANQVIAVPMGRWLTEDLILEADKIEKGVARRASVRLGIAETTFRRQLDKLKQTEQAGLLSRTADWDDIQPLLVELLTQIDEATSQNMIDEVRTLLMLQVIKLIPKDKVLCSALMGVTLPTFHKWLDKIDN